MKFRLLIIAVLGAVCAGFSRLTEPPICLANSIAVRPGRADTALADEAIGRYAVLKIGTDENHVGLCDAADIPLGFTTESSAAAAEDRVAFDLFGLGENHAEATASGAIAAGDMLVPADNGKLKKLPVVGGTYYICGRARTAAADAAKVVFVPCFPIQRVVP
jgi:hypothetical protein